MEQPCADERLFRLLAHYGALGTEDRETWRDRVMELDGRSDDLAVLHGELIAQDWVEQNTGATPLIAPGVVAQCYRVTPAGLRAFKQARRTRDLAMPEDVRPAA
jgi:hypothetical protein